MKRTPAPKPTTGKRPVRGSKAKTPAQPESGAPFERLLGRVRPEVDERLASALRSEIAGNGKLGSEVRLALEAAAALTSRGGKRLRAALVVAGFEAVSRSRGTRREAEAALALELGVAVELLQSYFLIHDDWMDADDVRRGGPAVHAALRGSFGSVHKADSGAVLAGDYLVALATGHLTRHAADHATFGGLMAEFVDMQLAAVTGQLLDVVGLTRDAEQVYRLKTGSYTVRGPLRLGAVLGGAKPEQLAQFDAYAQPIGFAFQLRDDLLGAFGDPKLTGKPFGSDVRAGKWTWIAQHAFEHAKGKDLERLKLGFANNDASERDLAAAVQVLESSGSRAAAEQLIDQLVKRARRALSKLDVSAESTALLASAIDLFATRAS